MLSLKRYFFVLIFTISGPLAFGQECIYNYAITHGDVESIRRQIATSSNLDIHCEAEYGEYKGLTALMVTALYGVDEARAQIATLLIQAGADVGRKHRCFGFSEEPKKPGSEITVAEAPIGEF